MPIGKNDMVRIHSDATTKPQSCSSGVFIRFGKVDETLGLATDMAYLSNHLQI